VTWLGHATVVVEDVARVVTDPLLTGGLAHLRRRAGPVPGAPSRPIDAIVISHLHLDHLHLHSLSLFRAGTPVLVPRGGARLFRRSRLHPVEVVAGDLVEVRGASIRVVPAVHAGNRWPIGAVRGEAVGYVIRGRGETYFAGDTSRFPEMSEVSPSLDMALLPVGGWGPWLRGHHLDPREAAACLPLLDPAAAVPIHYGTFWPRGLGWLRSRAFYEPGREFADHARTAAPGVDVRVLPPGAATRVQVRPDRGAAPEAPRPGHRR
jgi:L-ascorbate metabolism protein UlaG (beta-lactamase superfamily)